MFFLIIVQNLVSKGFFHIDPFIIVAIFSWNNMNPLEHYQLLAFFTHCLFDLKILVMILRKQTIAFLRQSYITLSRLFGNL